MSAQFVLATSSDTLVYDAGEFKIYQNERSFRIENNSGKILYNHLKYVGPAIRFWQILDDKNRIFYLDQEMKITEPENNFFGLCGTVPHYELKVQSNKKEFLIMEDETFYDYGNEIPAEIKFRISKQDADEVYFINGKKEFNYDGNYGIGSLKAQPDLVIYRKNGKFGIWQDESKTLYDYIEFEDLNLKLYQNGKVGYHGLTEVKYKEIQPFIYNLAGIKTAEGKTGFVDMQGKEYLN